MSQAKYDFMAKIQNIQSMFTYLITLLQNKLLKLPTMTSGTSKNQ
jgi:hypothetical protein